MFYPIIETLDVDYTGLTREYSQFDNPKIRCI